MYSTYYTSVCGSEMYVGKRMCERDGETRNMQPKHRNTNSHALSGKRTKSVRSSITFYVELCEWDVIRSGTWMHFFRFCFRNWRVWGNYNNIFVLLLSFGSNPKLIGNVEWSLKLIGSNGDVEILGGKEAMNWRNVHDGLNIWKARWKRSIWLTEGSWCHRS